MLAAVIATVLQGGSSRRIVSATISKPILLEVAH
jgi:hypothetical protein